MKVLIIEDDPSIGNHLRDVMNKRDYHYQIETKSYLGVEATAEFQPDLVFLDFGCTDLDSNWILKKIRDLHQHPIVVLLVPKEQEQKAKEGVALGANNYLTVPLKNGQLGELLDRYQAISEENKTDDKIDELIVERSFFIQFANDLHEVPKIAKHLLKEAGDVIDENSSLMVELGLSELVANAIEHGNLGISGKEKRKALEQGRRDFYALVEERKQIEEFSNRKVSVNFIRTKDFCEWTISDEGKGFDWQAIADPTQGDAIMIAHGRGIYLSRAAFDELTYLDNGATVKVRKNIGDTEIDDDDDA